MMTTIRTKTKKITKPLLWVAVLLLSLSSCEEYLDVEPQDKLAGEQLYRNVYDADAVVIGIYGKFMGLASKYVILNEMRADLMTTTYNSDPYLKELSEQNISAENPYVNPKDFYEVIQNCNDALKNFNIMVAEKKFTQSQYEQRYADIACIRSWIYLQLGIQYGTVPYITDPITSLEDVKNVSKYPRLSFNQLLDELVKFTEGLTYKKQYDATSSLVVTVDGYYTPKFFINKECLLGDLQLWRGNYQQAAMHYKNVLETSSDLPSSTALYETYRMSIFGGSGNNDFLVAYPSGQYYDASAVYNTDTQGWRSMFARTRDAVWNTEWIWSLPFDSKFAPKNPFIAIFSKTGGQYLAKPSQRAISLWESTSNYQKNGIPYDARGKKFTYRMVGNDPVIMKYLYKYEAAADVFKTDGDWFLYRAEKLNLRYAEAANRDNQHRIADAILNVGILKSFNRGNLSVSTDDVTNAMNTVIGKNQRPFPYDFDARQGEHPYYRGNWYRGGGVRGRANLQPAAVVVGDSLTSIEDNIIDEAGLSLAYEGNRWEDLVRISLRRNNPAFLADKVYDKLNKEGNTHAAEVRAKLMNVNNWYLPFTWK
ncbi:SusD-like starch-binding protein associating with outer membrane [Flavobacterium sp. 1]|uniref:RagB/SusD family nutrient uptake outer membrane protein n=1 Tax=Flavobacterium sp. 1 TaxID=2035200 RepID=UPI000CCACAEB|nr:RagB/SusD family nutrient uptake outer membrane protein [Flavobacterium sp. 1]PJJ10482.1 SusD-like starch-binding protein associating with outer membrane [Flavobacterium sp. 1]